MRSHNESPKPAQLNLYAQDGKYNTTYTVCHNARIDRTPYIRKSKEKQSKAVAVKASPMQPSPNRFGKYTFIARSNRPQYRDKHPIEDCCIKAELTTRKPRSRIAVLNNQTITQIENQNFVEIGAGTPLWEK
jgi:hypothetical protein